MLDIRKVLEFEELLARGFTSEEKEFYFTSGRKIRKTKGLFHNYLDSSRDENTTCLYTLSDCRPSYYKVSPNGVVRYDLRQLYLGCRDITENEFVSKFLYDTKQWAKLNASPLFGSTIKEWRDEQRLRVKSEMFGVILEDALDAGSKSKTASARYLLEKYYDPKTKDNKQSSTARKRDKEELMVLVKEDAARLSKTIN